MKKILSETSRHRALIFSMLHRLMDLKQVCLPEDVALSKNS